MKAIRIIRNNREKIESELELVQKRTSCRNVTIDEIFDVVNDVQKIYKVSKKALNGLTVTVNLNAKKFPGAYKYIPYCTVFKIKFTNVGANLIYIWRDKCDDKVYRVLEFPTDLKDAIIEKAQKLW